MRTKELGLPILTKLLNRLARSDSLVTSSYCPSVLLAPDWDASDTSVGAARERVDNSNSDSNDSSDITVLETDSCIVSML